MRGVAGALVLTVLVQGCVGVLSGLDGCDDAELAVLVGPGPIDRPLPRAAGENVEFLYWARHGVDDDGPVDLVLDGSVQVPATPSTQPDGDGDDGPLGGANGTAFGVFDRRFEPTDADATLLIEGRVGTDCALDAARATQLSFAAETDGPRAQPGVGVHVFTAGFWTNGTLFYTNMERVQFDDAYPKAEAGQMTEWEGGDPLPVYVYEDSREEQPARYSESGFFTTITGFNEALKGMQVGTSRVAVLAPEDAYTRPDATDHPLYGDALVFYIELLRIEDVPCEVPDPVCEVPRVPEPPKVIGPSI